MALYFRDDVPLPRPAVGQGRRARRPSRVHDAIRERLERGASFWTDLLADVAEVGGASVEPAELQEALWDLVWAGEVTNDAFAPLRAPRLSLARAASASRARRGRFATPPPSRRAADPGPLVADRAAVRGRARPRASACARSSEILLERYGIVTREQALAEGIPGGFSSLYPELANLETLGTARRGYFVEGLGGAQFALAAAVERLRGLRSDEPAGGLVLAATDPANPYGAALPWPKRSDDDDLGPPARSACPAPTS